MNLVTDIRICRKHNRNNGGYWNLVGPVLEHHVEGYNLKRNEGGFKGKEVDTSAETKSWINKAVGKSNL